MYLRPPAVSWQTLEKEVSSPKKAFGLNSTIYLDTLAPCKHRAIVKSKSQGAVGSARDYLAFRKPPEIVLHITLSSDRIDTRAWLPGLPSSSPMNVLSQFPFEVRFEHF